MSSKKVSFFIELQGDRFKLDLKLKKLLLIWRELWTRLTLKKEAQIQPK